MNSEKLPKQKKVLRKHINQLLSSRDFTITRDLADCVRK